MANSRFTLKGCLKIALIGLSVLAGLALVGFYLLDRLFSEPLFSELCGNEIFQEVAEPNGRFKAVLFQRDCGATTGFSTQISLIPQDQSLPNESGNLFIAGGHPQDIQLSLQWRTPGNLTIGKSTGLKIIKKETSYEEIHVHYEVVGPTNVRD